MSQRFDKHLERRRWSGRAAAPALLGVLLMVFIALVLVQLLQQQGDERIAAPISSTKPKDPAGTTPLIAPNQVAPAAPATGASPSSDAPAAVPAAIRDQVLKLLADMSLPANSEPKKLLVAYHARHDLEALLKTMPESSVPWLAELMNEEPDPIKRRLLIQALGEIGGDAAAQALRNHYEKIKDHDGPNEVKYTVESLGKIDNGLSFDLLTGLVEDGNPDHQFRFLTELGNHSQGHRAQPLFLHKLGGDRNLHTRNRAAQALKKVGDAEAAAEIERLLPNEDKYNVRQTMIGALGSIGQQTSLPILEDIAINDSELATRLAAIDSIAKIGGKTAKTILERVEQNAQHDRVKRDVRREIVRLEQKGW